MTRIIRAFYGTTFRYFYSWDAFNNFLAELRATHTGKDIENTDGQKIGTFEELTDDDT